MDKSIGAIIDAELKKIDDEQKSLAAKEEKLKERIVKGKEALLADEKELGTVQTCILEIERERGRVIKRALAGAGIALEPAVMRAKAAAGDRIRRMQNAAPRDVLVFINTTGSKTTTEIQEQFKDSEFAKRLAVIVSGSLKSKGYITMQKIEQGRGSTYTITAEGKAVLRPRNQVPEERPA